MNKHQKKTSPNNKEASSSEIIRESKLGHMWAGVFLCVSTFIAYSASFNGTWALDDSILGQFQNILGVLDIRLGYRKIAYLTFQINKLIDPINPLNYRLFNILIHFVNAMLIYRITFMTLRLPGLKDKYGRYAYAASLVGAAAFALHPININAVTYIVQRMASLATMFVLLSLISYILARTSNSPLKSTGFYAATGAFIVLGTFSKENGIMAVPLLLLYDFFFLRKDFKKSFVQVGVGVTAILLALGVSYFFLDLKKQFISIGSTLLSINQPISVMGWTAVDVYWTPLQHILTEFRVIARYLFLLFVPFPRFLVFDWWGFPVSTGIVHPLSTLTSFLMIVSIVSFAVYKRKELPFLSFGILWYFIALSLESFIAVGADLYFEHRNYLPVAGLVFGASSQLMTMQALRGKVLNLKMLWTGTVILSLFLGLLTFQRNLAWRDSVTLWTDTVGKTRENLRALIALGNSYLKISESDAAKKYYADAIRISALRRTPGFFLESTYSLGMLLLSEGDLEHAKKIIEVLDTKVTESYKTTILRGYYSSLSGDLNGAILQLQGILPLTSGTERVIVYTLLGDVFRKLEQPDLALESYRKAVDIDTSFSAAYYGMGDVYLSKGDIIRATFYIDKTLALDPKNVLALADMSDILLIKREPLERVREFAARAVERSPIFGQPYLAMGNVLIVMGKEDEAERFFEKAEKRGVKDYLISFSKARAYFIKGEGAKMNAYLRKVLSSKDTPENLRQTISAGIRGKEY